MDNETQFYKSSLRFKTITFNDNDNPIQQSRAFRKRPSMSAHMPRKISKPPKYQTISHSEMKQTKKQSIYHSSYCLSQKQHSLVNISVQVLRGRNLSNNPYELIRKNAQTSYKNNDPESKQKLMQILSLKHKLFEKVDRGITQFIVLMGKITFYSPQYLIFDDAVEDQNRSVDDIGFLLYGKMELKNQRKYYSKKVKDHQTLFEHKIIFNQEIYRYFCKTVTECCVLWLPKKQFYLIRRKCLLNWDLRHKFIEFQNLLKFYFVEKKLKTVMDQWGSRK